MAREREEASAANNVPRDQCNLSKEAKLSLFTSRTKLLYRQQLMACASKQYGKSGYLNRKIFCAPRLRKLFAVSIKAANVRMSEYFHIVAKVFNQYPIINRLYILNIGCSPMCQCDRCDDDATATCIDGQKANTKPPSCGLALCIVPYRWQCHLFNISI